MLICPVCNGIIEYIGICPNCKSQMKVQDRVETYFDEYAQNLEQNLLENSKQVCSHYCYCENCGKTTTVKIEKIQE